MTTKIAKTNQILLFKFAVQIWIGCRKYITFKEFNDHITHRPDYGHTMLSIQSAYDAVLVYTLGSAVPQLIPYDTIPTMVETPVNVLYRKIGPPESP